MAELHNPDMHEVSMLKKTLEPDPLPGYKGCLSKIHPYADRVWVVRSFEAREYKAALFDFDGNLSNERIGWPDVMVPLYTAFLLSYSVNKPTPEKAEELVLKLVELTIGKPTIVQTIGLVDLIEEYGYDGDQLNPWHFKDIYNIALKDMVKRRYAAAGNCDELLMPGAKALLEAITIPKYLATGSDVKDIVKSVEQLDLQKHFPEDHIVGSGSINSWKCAKEQVINNLINQQGLKGEEIIVFGDGYPEIWYGSKVGALTIALASDDKSALYQEKGYFTVEKKKDLLIRAGADVVAVPPFNVEALMKLTREGFSNL